MRKTLIVLAVLGFLLCSCDRASATYTVVNSCQDTQDANPSSCTLTIQPNKLLVAHGWLYNGGANPTPISQDTFGLTWHNALGSMNCSEYRGGTFHDYIYLLWAFTGANSGNETVGVTSAGSISFLQVVQFNVNGNLGGVDGSGQCAGNTTSGGAGTVSSSAITTSSANDLVIAIGESITTGVAATSGWTLAISPSNHLPGSPGIFLPISDQLSGAAGNYVGSFDQTGSGGLWILVAVAFQTSPPAFTHHKVSIY